MSGKRGFSTQVPVDLQRRVRAVVRGMQLVRGGGYTLSRFTTEALSAHAATLEGKYNGGQEWPHSPRLTPGARVTDPEEGT